MERVGSCGISKRRRFLCCMIVRRYQRLSWVLVIIGGYVKMDVSPGCSALTNHNHDPQTTTFPSSYAFPISQSIGYYDTSGGNRVAHAAQVNLRTTATAALLASF